jgi:hypothetical protein
VASEFLDIVLEMLINSGSDYTAKKTDRVATDPNKPWRGNGEDTPTTATVRAYIWDEMFDTEEGDVVRRVMGIRAVVAASGLAVDLRSFDFLDKYRIESVNPIVDKGETVAYLLKLKQ